MKVTVVLCLLGLFVVLATADRGYRESNRDRDESYGDEEDDRDYSRRRNRYRDRDGDRDEQRGYGHRRDHYRDRDDNQDNDYHNNKPVANAVDQNGRCGVPLNLKGFKVKPKLLLGTWFEYMYRTPGIDDINTVDTYEFVGCTKDGGVSTNWTEHFNLVGPGSPCQSLQGQLTISKDGIKSGLAYVLGGSTPSLETYTEFYTDYNLMEIYYSCQVPNQTLGICWTPFFFVLTRVRPAQLSTDQKARIAKKVEEELRPFCYTPSDLFFTAQDLVTLPICIPPRADGADALINQVATVNCDDDDDDDKDNYDDYHRRSGYKRH